MTLEQAIEEAIDQISDIPDFVKYGDDDALRAVLRSLVEKVQPRWREMSEAPKDGTLILLDLPYRIDVGSWFDDARGGGWWVSHALPVQPSKWMPLPAPPEGDVE